MKEGVRGAGELEVEGKEVVRDGRQLEKRGRGGEEREWEKRERGGVKRRGGGTRWLAEKSISLVIFFLAHPIVGEPLCPSQPPPPSSPRILPPSFSPPPRSSPSLTPSFPPGHPLPPPLRLLPDTDELSLSFYVTSALTAGPSPPRVF